jgi:hypothetical protein
MAKRWHYSIMFGLRGCYMPDSHFGAFTGTTRRELADTIRAALAFYDMPAWRFSDVRINRLWSLVKRHGSSSAHFSLDAEFGCCLEFIGMTEAEFAQAERDAE